ncbi:MAG: DUF481 domain-containing protein [Calditrichaeota bacterium]|nr:DUF481 domain-containing protein [Calditrichota bacterium]MBT7616121.1 DUF481 domain-containing protein [Calditrichota bacterium]
MRKAEVECGLKTTGSFDLDLKKGNTNFVSYGAGIRLDYWEGIYQSFAVASLKIAEKDETEFLNKSFIHIRGMRRTSKYVTTEMFAQIEWNKFLNLKLRRLLGGGFRIHLLDKSEALSLHLGLGVMYEGEQNTISSEADKNILRSSNYITGGCDLKENINLLTTGYFQPDMSDPADFRFIMESSLNVEMSEHFTFSTALKYRYDSQPSAGLEDYDLNVTNGIKLTF